MINSMTGFGRYESITEEYRISVEIKAVNHRYLEFSARVPRNYAFLEERLKRSANLLAQTEEPVSVISDYFSFASPSYFSSCFHRQYQMTPLEYRKRHKFQCN